MESYPVIEKVGDIDFREAHIPDDFKPIMEQFIEITNLYCQIVHAIIFPLMIYKASPKKEPEKEA